MRSKEIDCLSMAFDTERRSMYQFYWSWRLRIAVRLCGAADILAAEQVIQHQFVGSYART